MIQGLIIINIWIDHFTYLNDAELIIKMNYNTGEYYKYFWAFNIFDLTSRWELFKLL